MNLNAKTPRRQDAKTPRRQDAKNRGEIIDASGSPKNIVNRLVVVATGLTVVFLAVIGCLGEVGSSAKGYYEIQSTREVVTAALRNPQLIREIHPGALLFVLLVICHVSVCLSWPKQLLHSDGMLWPWMLSWFYPMIAMLPLTYLTLPFAPLILSDLSAGGRMDGEAWDDGAVLWLSGHFWIALSTVMLFRLFIYRLHFLWATRQSV